MGGTSSYSVSPEPEHLYPLTSSSFRAIIIRRNVQTEVDVGIGRFSKNLKSVSSPSLVALIL